MYPELPKCITCVSAKKCVYLVLAAIRIVYTFVLHFHQTEVGGHVRSFLHCSNSDSSEVREAYALAERLKAGDPSCRNFSVTMGSFFVDVARVDMQQYGIQDVNWTHVMLMPQVWYGVVRSRTLCHGMAWHSMTEWDVA